MDMPAPLTFNNHSRDSAGMKYVYPVVSRRAGGVSVGINLNTDNACNWACIYCQVPDLKRGTAPEIDLHQLESELRQFLESATSGDYLLHNTPPEARKLVDVAFSGNGEPTSAHAFPEAVAIAGRVLDELGLSTDVRLRLITNGSFLHRAYVREGIALMGERDGEVWFKIDRASPAGIKLVNHVTTTPEKVKRAVLTSSRLAPTWVQTCLFAIDGHPISEQEFGAYLELISSIKEEIKGILLYGLARPSLQPEANRLSALSTESLFVFAHRIRELGVEVVATP